jgi:hypothetical protein
MRKILGPEVGARLKPIWGLDPEGEIQGVWRDIGIPRLWCMMGKFFLVEGRERLSQTPTLGRELCTVPIPLEAHRTA